MDVIRRITHKLGCELRKPATPHFTPRPTIAPPATTTAPTGTYAARSAAAVSASAPCMNASSLSSLMDQSSHRQSRR
jgi:hypothetical protein